MQEGEKAPPQCEDWNRDENPPEKNERARTEHRLAFMFVRVSIFHKVCLLLPEAITWNCQLLARREKEVDVIHSWIQLTGFSISTEALSFPR